MWKAHWKSASSAKTRWRSRQSWSPSGSAGTHAGLAVGLEQLMPQAELIGVTVSRSVADQLPKVVALQQAVANSLELQAKAEIILWDDYFARDTVRQTKMGWPL